MATVDSGAPVASGGAALASEIERLKRRDQAAWSNLFENHYSLIFRAVLGEVRNQAVAEDIAGQVFLEAYQGIGRYRGRAKPITTWLLAIGRRRSRDWLREQQRLAQVPLTPEAPAMEPEDFARAVEAIDYLPPPEREVLLLRYVEGYPLEAVGRLTNRPMPVVRSLEQRGLESLRHLLLRPPEWPDR